MNDDIQLTPFKEFRRDITGPQRKELEKMLPEGMDVERFVRTALNAVQRNENLLYADRLSLWDACMRAAQDGLLPDGREAVFNIYDTKKKVWSEKIGRDVETYVPTVQYLPMVRGIIKAMYNTGCVAHIDAAAVYDLDHFKFRRGDAAGIEHEPYEGSEDPGPIKAAYVIIKFTNGEIHREVMYRRDIDKVRQASKNADRGPWVKWFDQMAIKSVIKRAAKLMPADSEALLRVIEHDNDAMGYRQGFDDIDDVPVRDDSPPPDTAPALTDERAAQQAAQVPQQAAARRPSRMASIMARHAPAQDDEPPWTDADVR